MAAANHTPTVQTATHLLDETTPETWTIDPRKHAVEARHDDWTLVVHVVDHDDGLDYHVVLHHDSALDSQGIHNLVAEGEPEGVDATRALLDRFIESRTDLLLEHLVTEGAVVSRLALADASDALSDYAETHVECGGDEHHAGRMRTAVHEFESALDDDRRQPTSSTVIVDPTQIRVAVDYLEDYLSLLTGDYATDVQDAVELLADANERSA